MKVNTPAEQQMEELRKLRETMSKRKPLPAQPKASTSKPLPSGAPPAPSGTVGGFELSEAQPKKKKEGPSLPVSSALYRQILQRQRERRAFKRRRDLGDWAAELALALPFEAHRLSPQAKAELFQRMQEWAAARGLK